MISVDPFVSLLDRTQYNLILDVPDSDFLTKLNLSLIPVSTGVGQRIRPSRLVSDFVSGIEYLSCFIETDLGRGHMSLPLVVVLRVRVCGHCVSSV